MIQRFIGFLKDTRAELGKITWPTWTELKGSTVVVIVTVIILTIFIGAVDQVFNTGLKFLIRNL